MTINLRELQQLHHDTDADHPVVQRLPNHTRSHEFQRCADYIFIKRTGLKTNHHLIGWAYYISVCHDDLESAWDAIAPILFDNTKDILAFSIIRTDSPVLHTKQIVIHPLKDSAGEHLQDPDNFYASLVSIQKALRDKKIRVGNTPVAAEKMQGSHYISRRQEWDRQGRYISESDALEINPHNPTNPYGRSDTFPEFKMPIRKHPIHKTSLFQVRNTPPTGREDMSLTLVNMLKNAGI